MSHPPLATHMLSFPDGKTGNNALGYCSGPSADPSRPLVLVPVGSAWPRWALKGTKVVVKWLKLPGQPEFLHVLDGETSTSNRLPRRVLQRSADDIVTIRTQRTQHYPADTALDYGTASAFVGNMVTVTPLGRWLRDLPVGAAVEIVNLSAPGNSLKSGAFGSQSSVVKSGSARVRFLKDSPGG
jgi:hypothetical protein